MMNASTESSKQEVPVIELPKCMDDPSIEGSTDDLSSPDTKSAESPKKKKNTKLSALLGARQMTGTNLTKSPRYYDYKTSEGKDHRGRPLHDAVHLECSNSVLTMKDPWINLHGFFVLCCCIGAATMIKNIMHHFRTYGRVSTLSIKIDHEFFHDISRVAIGYVGLFLAGALVFIVQTWFESSKRPITPEDKNRLQTEKKRGRRERGHSHGDSWTITQEEPSDKLLRSHSASLARSTEDLSDLITPRDASFTNAPVSPSVTEKVAESSKKKSDRVIYAETMTRRWTSIAIICLCFIVGHKWTTTQFYGWVYRGFYLLSVVTMSMKLISFVHVAHDYRRAYTQGTPWTEIGGTTEDIDVLLKNEDFSDIFSFKHFVRFWWMPTLIFQFHYPSTKSINWFSIAVNCILFCTEAVVIKLIKQQYIMLSLNELFTSDSWREEQSIVRLGSLFAEYILRLATPLILSWILFFLMFFQHGMSIAAELTYFGDRRFFLDWWNSAGFSEYWRKWNLPVHNFATRHIYKPLLSFGIPHVLAGIIVFTISALAHEYLINTTWNIPYTFLVFTSFLAQLPMMIFFDRMVSGVVGNALFWVIFCVTGQPIAMAFIYYTVGTTEGYIEPRSINLNQSAEAQLLLDVITKLQATGAENISRANLDALQEYFGLLRNNVAYGQTLLSKFVSEKLPNVQ